LAQGQLASLARREQPGLLEQLIFNSY